MVAADGYANALESAHQQRAEYVGQIAGRPLRLSNSSMLCLAAAGAIFIALAYVAGLSHANLSMGAGALIAVLVASTLSSIAGFAFSAICGVMLLSLMPNPVQVVEIMMVCSVAIQGLSVILIWRNIAWSDLPLFLIGGIVGLPIGVLLLLHLGDAGVKEAIGVLLIAYSGYALVKRRMSLSIKSRLADVAFGIVGGITGGLAGIPGAPVTVVCGLKGWDKSRQRGLYQPFILIMQILALLLIQTMRTQSAPAVAWPDLQFVPMALLGTLLGFGVFKRLSDRSFTVVVNVLLLISGFGLLA